MESIWDTNERETFSQRFGRVSGAASARPTHLESNIRDAMIGLIVQLQPSSEQPDTDFRPTLKTDRGERVNLGPEGGEAGLDQVRRIRSLSIEQGGVQHDFPIRFEDAGGLTGLRALFNATANSPKVFITGLDGREREFQTYAKGSGWHRSHLDSTEPVAAFMVDELARKHGMEAGRAAPRAAPQPQF